MQPRSSAGAIRRAARAFAPAVTLIWLLVGPPIDDGAPRPDAPRNLWLQYGVFQSEAECLRAKEFMGRVTGDGKYGWERAYWDDLVRCSSPDDREPAARS